MSEAIREFSGPNRFLSNFYHCHFGVRYDLILYPTAEHAYQAAKTLDEEERAKIYALATPGKAKRAGRKVKLRAGWNEMRIDVMREILRSKFARDPDLRRKLLATGDAQLIEGNTWNDRFWGVCLGKGCNHLGKVLMEVRAELAG